MTATYRLYQAFHFRTSTTTLHVDRDLFYFLLLIIFAKITNIRLVLVILYADNFFVLIIFCDYVISGVARNYV